MEQKQNSNDGPLKSYVLGENALDEIQANEIKEFVEGVCILHCDKVLSMCPLHLVVRQLIVLMPWLSVYDLLQRLAVLEADEEE